jgi:hypothetical protein
LAASPTEVLRQVVQVLDDLGVPYVIGGSFASSAYGEARSTRDADLVVELHADSIEALASRFESDFYISRDAMREAIREHRSFNAIHLESMFKVDFFVRGESAFDREEFGRRIARPLQELGGHTWFIKTPEDTVLRKLEWYRASGDTSEQQWRDVLGVLAVWRGRLDDGYLDRWAVTLGVSDLLERARRAVAVL